MADTVYVRMVERVPTHFMTWNPLDIFVCRWFNISSLKVSVWAVSARGHNTYNIYVNFFPD